MHLQAVAFLLLLAPLCRFAAPAELEDGRCGDIPGWTEASAFAQEHRSLWKEVFESLDAEPLECEAVVFPELLRYSRLRDGLEQAALLSLYVKGGKDAADFSVGIFQMKPSFAEQVESAWMRSQLRDSYKLYFDTRDIEEARSKRISRLRDESWQCVYLAAFVRLMLEREPALERFRAVERVRLLATAYNFSFSASMDELSERMGRKTFHLDLVRLKGTRCFSYSDLAARHYRQSTRSSFTNQLKPIKNEKDFCFCSRLLCGDGSFRPVRRAVLLRH